MITKVFFQIFILIGLIGLTFTFRSNQTITDRDPRIDPSWKNKIELYRPSVIFLGNSMLGEGIDTNLFQKQTDIKAMKIYTGGAASAWWYTIFKNSIVEAEHKPKLVVIFFRDQFLRVITINDGENA
jgi:hypothetical protein